MRTFRVRPRTLILKSIREHPDRSMVRPEGFSPPFTFITRAGVMPKHSRPWSTPWSVFQDGSLATITPASVQKRVPRSAPAAWHPSL